MRDTGLYFKLGTELLRIVGGKADQKALTTLARAISKLQREFDDSSNVFQWSIRFVRSFQNQEYFGEVSQICHFSFGQLREVVEILDHENPLKISQSDLKHFIAKMRGPVTYEEVRKICKDLKTKYLGQIPDIDTADIRDSFDEVEQQAIVLLDDGGPIQRQAWREKAGIESITAVRHLLMLLAREEIFENIKRNKLNVLRGLRPDIHSSDINLDNLYHFLLEFLISGKTSREFIRKVITPIEMGHLQTMMKALMAENNYASFAQTKNLFDEINI